MTTETADSIATEQKTHGKAIIAGLWLVAIYFILTSVGGLISYIFLLSGISPISPEQAKYVESLSLVVLATSLGLMLLNLIGGVLLILRRKVALHVLIASALLNLIYLSYTLISGMAPAPGVTTTQILLPYVVLAAVLLFVFTLYKKGVLCR